jgi:thiamine biosynthesis lipoprotein
VTGATARTEVHLGTVVSISVCRNTPESRAAVDRAFQWFREVDAQCSRFTPNSDLLQLMQRPGVPIAVNDLLFEAVRFAVNVAEDTEGALDPTVGHVMETRGFDRDHRNGTAVRSGITPEADVSYRDVVCNDEDRTITLLRPLVLDLGAVAKGLAIDMAAQELLPFDDFAIDAGGDLYLGGSNPEGRPWSVGIRHPHVDRELIDVLLARDQAVCTSGNYERGPESGGHIIDPRTGQPVTAVASVTVLAPTAMLADAAATAAFVLGPTDGLALCEQLGLEALIIRPDLIRHETPGLRRPPAE